MEAMAQEKDFFHKVNKLTEEIVKHRGGKYESFILSDFLKKISQVVEWMNLFVENTELQGAICELLNLLLDPITFQFRFSKILDFINTLSFDNQGDIRSYLFNLISKFPNNHCIQRHGWAILHTIGPQSNQDEQTCEHQASDELDWKQLILAFSIMANFPNDAGIYLSLCHLIYETFLPYHDSFREGLHQEWLIDNKQKMTVLFNGGMEQIIKCDNGSDHGIKILAIFSQNYPAKLAQWGANMDKVNAYYWKHLDK